jgi:hypothetical protein
MYEEESKNNLNIFLLTEYVQIVLLFDSSLYIQVYVGATNPFS